jgi:RNA polymerase sigma factor (sigma-70 family)
MQPSPDDPDTLHHARQAQRDASSPSWGPLARKVRDRLDRHRTRRLPARLDFDDFVAEVMVRLLRELPRTEVRSRAELWSWLDTVAGHVLVDLWRRDRAQKRGDEVQMPVDDEQRPLERAGAEPRPSALHRAVEIEAVEQDCIDALPNELGRRVYALRRKHELAFDEIAARTGQASAAAARYVFFRMKYLVQSCLRSKLERDYSRFFARLDEQPN